MFFSGVEEKWCGRASFQFAQVQFKKLRYSADQTGKLYQFYEISYHRIHRISLFPVPLCIPDMAVYLLGLVLFVWKFLTRMRHQINFRSTQINDAFAVL